MFYEDFFLIKKLFIIDAYFKGKNVQNWNDAYFKRKMCKIRRLILNSLSQMLKLKMLNTLKKLKDVNLKKHISLA